MPIRKFAHYEIRSHALKVPSHSVGGGLASSRMPATRRVARRLVQKGAMKLELLRFTSSKSFRPALSLPARAAATEHPSREAEAPTVYLSGLQGWLSFKTCSTQEPALGERHCSQFWTVLTFCRRHLLVRPSNLTFNFLKLQQWGLIPHGWVI